MSVDASGRGERAPRKFQSPRFRFRDQDIAITMRSFRRQNFLERLTQRYAYSVIRDQAREQNLIVEEELEANGDIILVLSERG